VIIFNTVTEKSNRFPEIGEAFEKANPEEYHVGKLGQADCWIIQMKPLIEFGTKWLQEHPVTEDEQ